MNQHPPGPSPHRLPLIAGLVVIALAAARVAAVWDRLPPTMASHFGPSGRADAFMPRDGFFWVFGGLAGGTTLLVLLMPWLLKKLPPSLVNLPHREYWLAPERRAEAIARLGGWLAWLGVALAVFMFVALELTLQANLERRPLANGPFMAALIGFLALTIGMLVGLYRRFRIPEAPRS